MLVSISVIIVLSCFVTDMGVTCDAITEEANSTVDALDGAEEISVTNLEGVFGSGDVGFVSSSEGSSD